MAHDLASGCVPRPEAGLAAPPQPERAQRAEQTSLSGALLFARYAYPPNSLGYCGPADSSALLQHAAAGVADRGLAELARQFAGAWPYLELIAGATGIGDPLDYRVVEAYWLGNALLDRIGLPLLAASMEQRFRPRTGRQFPYLMENVLAGGVPQHSFHVFAVYPWVGLLGDDRKARHALTVLDRCRIRWGRVTAVEVDQAVVRSRPLRWDGRELSLGEPVPEVAIRSAAGTGYLGGLVPGDWVSLHWDWVCDRLTRRQLAALRHHTLRQLEITNHRVAHPGPALLLG